VSPKVNPDDENQFTFKFLPFSIKKVKELVPNISPPLK
jgi:hypothetical protein